MRRYLAYARYVIRHCGYVRRACWRVGLYRRGLQHDLSKWRPSEFIPYARHFYNSDGSQRRGEESLEFSAAWLLHQKRNDHHWQWWVLPQDDGATICLNMEPDAALEALCDWYGAARAQGKVGAVAMWFFDNQSKMSLHPATRAWFVETVAPFEQYLRTLSWRESRRHPWKGWER